MQNFCKMKYLFFVRGKIIKQGFHITRRFESFLYYYYYLHFLLQH